MKTLSKREQIVVGIALFSMFFGAGNLIFPPLMGQRAGTSALPAFAGFAVSAIGLPILGVAAIARMGDLGVLAGRVGKVFAAVYTVLIYLSIGPCLAIPRTASTSFEMAVTPFLPGGAPVLLLRALFSAAFFAVALRFALRPAKLVELLGKRLAPVLLALIAALTIGGLVRGFSGGFAPAAAYTAAPLAQGFLDGYQTMDAIAALIFGSVLILNLRARGVTEDRAIVRVTLRAGVIAAILFAAVYGALTWMGKTCPASASNGAVILTDVARRAFGGAGVALLAGIFLLACLNTCISLLCCCGAYFHKLLPRLSYPAWTVIFAGVSAVLANAGLSWILKISVPILGCLYPVAILLIALSFLPAKLRDTRPLLFPLTVAFGGVVGAVAALADAGLVIPGLGRLVALLPLYASGLSWVLPALLGAVISLPFVKKQPPQAA